MLWSVLTVRQRRTHDVCQAETASIVVKLQKNTQNEPENIIHDFYFIKIYEPSILKKIRKIIIFHDFWLLTADSHDFWSIVANLYHSWMQKMETPDSKL